MGIFSQISGAMKMRNESRKIQNEIAKLSATYSNGGITCVAKGDMSIISITCEPGAYDEVKAGKPSRFETMLLNVVNGALKKVREETQQELQRILKQSGDIANLLGK